MSAQPLRVGVLGAGTVGREVVRAFLERSTGWRRRRGAADPRRRRGPPTRHRRSGIPAELLTDAPAHLVADPDIDVVVEVMGGAEPARTLVAAALAAGKRVVTANKHIVAHHGPELERLARAAGVTFRFEAAVGGGIPLLGPIAQDLAANRITRVRGIVNGTTNYMLTAMTREGRDYAEVLAEAQAKGYAEADPTADVEGLDALNKLVILARLAFGEWIDPSVIGNRPGTTTGATGLPGITGVTAEDVAALAGRAGCSASSPRRGSPRTARSRPPSSPPRSRPIRPSGAATACSTGSRSTRPRWAGSPSRGQVPAGPPPVPRSSATSSRSPGASARRGPARRPPRALPPPGAAGRRRVRRGALGRLLPGRGLIADDHAARPPPPRRALPRVPPVTDATPVVSLGEGATPLVAARRLGEAIGVPNLHLKIEGLNPTGSFKDRGMVVAVAKAIEEGARSVICASTGNTSAIGRRLRRRGRPRVRRRAAGRQDRRWASCSRRWSSARGW